MAKSQHPDHSPIDDDYDDDDIVGLARANVTVAPQPTPGSPAAIAYAKQMAAFAAAFPPDQGDTQFKRPSGEAGGGKLDLAKYRRKK